jgi:hypothetical protein
MSINWDDPAERLRLIEADTSATANYYATTFINTLCDRRG